MVPILDACIRGDLNEVKHILDPLTSSDRNTLLVMTDDKGFNCYLLSFIHKNYDVLRYICKGKSEVDLVMNDVFCNIDNQELNCKLHNIIENLPELTEDENDETDVLELTEDEILEKIRIELQNNVDSLHGRDCEHNTPLHTACQNRYYKIVKLLLDNGAKVNAVNVFLQEPIHILCDLTQKDTPDNFAKILNLLLEHGANLNALDIHYETPCDKLFCHQADLLFPFQYTSSIQKAFTKIAINHMFTSFETYKKKNSLTTQVQELLIHASIALKKLDDKNK